MTMPESYARALLKVVADGQTPKKAVAALRDTLVRSGRERLLPKIARALSRIAARHERKDRVVLTVAREKDATRALKDLAETLSRMGVAAKDVEVDEDEHVVGGWRLEGKERLVDASYKKFLLDMYNRTTNTV